MIIYPLFYRMHVAEYLTYSDRIFALILELATESITFEPFKSRIEQSLIRLRKTQEKVNTQILTETVGLCDARRDQAVIAFETFALACSKRLNVEVSEAGKEILNEINSHGPNLIRRPMLEESAIIKSLVEKIKTNTKLSEALTKIDGGVWMQEVEEAENDFGIAIESRGEAKLDRSEESGIEVCKEIKKEFESFFKYLDVMCELEADAVYENLAKEMNIVSEETNVLVSQRVGRLASVKEEETE